MAVLAVLAAGCNVESSAHGRVVFASDRDGIPEIYVLDLQSQGLLRLTENGSLDTNPDWSPDGSRVAFTSNRDGDVDLYTMEL